MSDNKEQDILSQWITAKKSERGIKDLSPKLSHKSVNAGTVYGTTILSYSRTSIRIDPGTLKRGLEAKLIQNRLEEERATKENDEITQQSDEQSSEPSVNEETVKTPPQPRSPIIFGANRRLNVAKEIYETEQIYVQNLTLLIEEFYFKMKTDSRTNKLPLAELFSNIEDVVRINQVLLKNIETEMNRWDNSNTLLGRIFMDLGPYLKPYYIKYTENYPHAIEIIIEAEKTKEFGEYLDEIVVYNNQTISKKSLLRDLLIMPVQRVPRYNLLLTDLLKNTDKVHSDYEPLATALERMLVVASDINKAVELGNNREKILSIQKNLTGFKNLFVSHRVFVKEGAMKKVCRKSVKQRHFFLFNDILIYASSLIASSRYGAHLAFNNDEIQIEDIPDTDNKHAFQLTTPQKSFVVVAANRKDKLDWMLAIMNASEQWKIKKESFGNKLEEEEFIVAAPVWIPDSQVSNCGLCNEAFSLLKRRHHCRKCGGCFCGNCTSHQLVLPNLGSDGVRVCDMCFADLDPNVITGVGNRGSVASPSSSIIRTSSTTGLTRTVSKLGIK